MAASLTQSKIVHSSGVSTSYTIDFDSTPTPGSTVVVMCGGQLGIPGASTATVTDNQGNTYTQLVLQSGGNCLGAIFACANVAATGTFTITVTYDQQQVHNNFIIEEWAGMPATLSTDGSSHSSGNNNGATQSCGTLTTANADDVLFAFVINNGNSPLNETAPSGYTLDQSYLFQVGAAGAYDIVSGTVSALVEFTTTDSTGQWNGVTAALQSSGGPTTQTVDPSGIAPGGMGTPYVQANITVTGIPPGGVGTPNIKGSTQDVTLTAGIASAEAFGTPSFTGSTQTLILAGKGINTGAIGTPTVVGGNSQQRILIGGVDRTAYLSTVGASATSGGPVHITKQLAQPAVATFTLHMSSLVFRPTCDDSVEIYDGGLLWFRGQISQVIEAVEMSTAAQYEFSCSCTDQSIVATRRFVTQTYGLANTAYFLSLRDVVLDIVANYLSGEGITTNHVGSLAAYGPGTPLVFDGVSVQDAFNTIASAGGNNFSWYIDQFNDLHFGVPGDGLSSNPAPFGISSGDRRYRNLTVQQNRSLYRNVQYVRSDQFLIQGARTEVFTAANWASGGGVIFFLTSFPIVSQPKVLLNGVEQPIFNLSSDPNAENEGFTWAPQAYGVVVKTPSIFNPGLGDTITIEYNGYLSNVIVEIDATEIAARQASGGGSGRYEAVEDVKGADLAQATAIANALLAQYANGGYPKVVVFETDYGGLDVNMLVHINLSEHSVNADFLVQQIDSTSIDGQNLGHGTSFRSQVTLVSTTNQGDWVTWFEALLAKVAQGTPAAVFEEATFILGAGGSLSTGTNGSNPYIVKQAGQIAFIKVIAGGAPSDDVFRCDILKSAAGLSGQTSIFAPGKFAEIPVNSTDLITYGPSILNPNPYYLKPDDILMPDVIIDQGESVTLVIGWQTNGPPVVAL